MLGACYCASLTTTNSTNHRWLVRLCVLCRVLNLTCAVTPHFAVLQLAAGAGTLTPAFAIVMGSLSGAQGVAGGAATGGLGRDHVAAAGTVTAGPAGSKVQQYSSSSVAWCCDPAVGLHA